MTSLSELLPAGGAGKVMDFVASGTLPNGSPVILKADGTVEVVAETIISQSIPSGSASVFYSASMEVPHVAFDPNNANTFIIVYKDLGSHYDGMLSVGTISGTSISFGTPYTFDSGMTSAAFVAFDPHNAGKFVISYDGYNVKQKAMVCTISGTSVTFGTATQLTTSGQAYVRSVSMDPNTPNKFVVLYLDYGNSGYPTVVVGTVSGTSISFGTPVVVRTIISGFDAATLEYDPNTAGRFVVGYQGSSSYGCAKVGTISGTTISLGSENIWNSIDTSIIALTMDTNTADTFVLFMLTRTVANASIKEGRCAVATISGTSISLGTKLSLGNSTDMSRVSMDFCSAVGNKFAVAYIDRSATPDDLKLVVGTTSGTSVSLGTASTISSGAADYDSMAFDLITQGRFVMVYKDVDNANYGTAKLGQITAALPNLTSTNFVGLTTEAITDTDTGSITLQGGLSTNQSSLTVGSNYYVQADGTVSTVSTAPAVNIGKALNATTLKLKGLSV
jgi:hypothetical protein